jgi:hypothetical protein
MAIATPFNAISLIFLYMAISCHSLVAMVT